MVVATTTAKLSEFVLSKDEELPEDSPNRSVFYLKTLNRREKHKLSKIFFRSFADIGDFYDEETGEIDDEVVLKKIGEGDDEDSAFERDMTLAVRLGVDHWDNVPDQDGNQIEAVSKNGRLTEKCVEWLEIEDLMELALAVVKGSALSEGDKKNSK